MINDANSQYYDFLAGGIVLKNYYNLILNSSIHTILLLPRTVSYGVEQHFDS